MSPTQSLQASPRRSYAALAGFLIVVFAAAAVGAVGSREAPDIYARLALPPWAPPASVFGPVWTVLYAMMGVAAWLVWREPGRHAGAMWLFGVQLVVNVLWSWCFFAWRNGALATADVVLLVALVAATVAAFWKVRALAGAIMLPYLAWVSFAAVLTVTVWQRNPAML
jgi:benzodiazapine receptor